ncbi:hypothetical protein NC652_029122 [Populus alba x Populus x berolinensis]|nr:hypothetical protein NC652_029122 [Populus alba x Populus x berolinensis]
MQKGASMLGNKEVACHFFFVKLAIHDVFGPSTGDKELWAFLLKIGLRRENGRIERNTFYG